MCYKSHFLSDLCSFQNLDKEEKKPKKILHPWPFNAQKKFEFENM